MNYTKKDIRLFRTINIVILIIGILVLLFLSKGIGIAIIVLALFFLFRPFPEDERVDDNSCSPYRFNTTNIVSNSGISPDTDIIRIGDTLEKCKQRFGGIHDTFRASFDRKVYMFRSPNYMIGTTFSEDGWADSVRYENHHESAMPSKEALALVELSTSYPTSSGGQISGDGDVIERSHSKGFKDVISANSAMIMTTEFITSLG